MTLRTRGLALLAALGLALSVGIAAAPAGQAVQAGKFEVQHLPGYYSDQNASIQVNRANGSYTTLYQKRTGGPTWVISDFYSSGSVPRSIVVPQGLCIWEEVWGNYGQTWYGNFNYCNYQTPARPLTVTLEGSKLREANGIESRLRFIKPQNQPA